MTGHRDEILAECLRGLDQTDAENLGAYVADFYDETLRALRRDCGIRESTSPLPDASDAAARFGADRQRAGLPVTRVPVIFAAISQALGSTGAKYDLTIAAEEYRMLNRCLDTGVATSIENYWRRDKDRENRVLTERFGFLAHELRNALGNTNLAFKLLRSGSLDVHGHTADVVARNLARMESLVAQCLTSVRLEVGVAPALAPVHVASVLRDLEASAMPERNVTIVLELDEQLFVLADQMLLTSAVSNLVHNALKFSPANATVRLVAQASQDSVWISVEDQCGGLGNATPETLFEPYVKRQEGNRTGTGLGLSIAKRAVEAMNGELSVEDHPGHGCSFKVRFPHLRR